MISNKLRSLLEPPQEPIGTSAEYWAENHIDLAFMIVITGRCGSTLLTHLLSSLSLFGKPDELFTEEMLPYMIAKYKTSSLSELLPNIVRDHSCNGSFGFQIDPLRLAWMSDYWDIKLDVCNSSLRFGAMIRQDLLSQAYSYLTSKKSGIWHRFSAETGKATLSVDSVLDCSDSSVLASLAKELLVELLLILRSEESIHQLSLETGVKPVMISYEELITDRFHSIYKLMRGLGASNASINGLALKRDLLQANPTTKSAYSFKEPIFDYLYNNYRDIVVSLNAERSALSSEIKALIDVL